MHTDLNIAGSELARARGGLDTAERALQRALHPDEDTVTVLRIMTALALVTLAREQNRHALTIVRQLRQRKRADLVEEVTHE